MTATDVYDCAIIGGGFTGLAAAAELSRTGRSVILIEKEHELGGLAAGFNVGEYELERFYHHWFTSDRHIFDLAQQIGVSDRVVVRDSVTGMYFAGKNFRLSTPLDLLGFTALPFHDRVRTGVAALRARRVKEWRDLEGVTAKDWLIKLFGANAFSVIWEPLLVGKFGKHADRISAVWFWNKLALRGGSRGKRGAEQLAYFRGGFAQLARDVAAYVTAKGGHIESGLEAKTIRRSESGVAVETAREPIHARTALVTTHLPVAARLLAESATAAELKAFRKIEYLGNVCLILEMNRSLSQFYWTNINDPNFPFVGIIEHTNFEPMASYGGRHIVYLSKYLATDDSLFDKDSHQMFEFAVPHIQRMFPEFRCSWVDGYHLWKAEYAQPIVVRHYSRLIPEFELSVPGVFLATMAQIYPEDRGTNYAVREGTRAAKEIDKRLPR